MTRPPARTGAPSPAPPASTDASGGEGRGSALTPEERQLLEAHQQLRQLKQQHLEKRAAEVADYKRRRNAEETARERERQDEAERAALEDEPRGPNLPPHRRRNAASYLQEEDLDELLPDGWGSWWPEESERWGERMGLPPAAVPLLRLLEWVQGLRASRGRGAAVGCGFQVGPEWLARKLGCSERWVQSLTARLDPWAEYRREARKVALRNASRALAGLEPLPKPPRPSGTAYLCRYPQLKLYKAVARGVPHLQRRERWLCRDGQLRRWVDLRGIYYATHQGLRQLRRRAHRAEKPRPGKRPKLARSPMAADLARRLSPLYRRVRARLAPRVAEEFTPNNVKPSVTDYVPAPRPRTLRLSSGAGPPGGRCGHLPRVGGRVRGDRKPSRAPPEG